MTCYEYNFDNFGKNVNLSIFKKGNEDPKTPVHYRYLGPVGLLEYVDIVSGDLTGRSLPEGIAGETVKGMIIHCISDLDTRQAMSTGPFSREFSNDFNY